MLLLFNIFSAPIVSLDWLDDENFAVSSIDPRVYAFKAGIKDPLFRFYHDADVNKVSWGPSNDTLMSCSDDSTLKFWHLGNETCLWTATGHESKVNTCQWSPTRGSNIAARLLKLSHTLLFF